LSETYILKSFEAFRKFPSAEEGLRAVVEHATQAEAFAESWILRVRPFLVTIYGLRRRIATIAVLVMAVCLFVHVMFGANGMIVYKKKRAEFESLQKRLQQVQQENDRYTQQIQGLKSDREAIEKEAREQLGYAKPGEYVYVPATQPKPIPPSVNHTTKR
jgi:cell division protein FtsB